LKNIQAATINQQQTLPVVKDNWEMIKCIAEGGDIWNPTFCITNKYTIHGTECEGKQVCLSWEEGRD